MAGSGNTTKQYEPDARSSEFTYSTECAYTSSTDIELMACPAREQRLHFRLAVLWSSTLPLNSAILEWRSTGVCAIHSPARSGRCWGRARTLRRAIGGRHDCGSVRLGRTVKRMLECIHVNIEIGKIRSEECLKNRAQLPPAQTRRFHARKMKAIAEIRGVT